MPKPKILWVDDDPNIIAASQRYLRKDYTVHAANSAHEGLIRIDKEGPFAVIISDLKMPGVDGIEFLAQAQIVTPDSIRIMLTGYAEQEVAINAVNRGNIFRFLTKPCHPSDILDAVGAAARQNELVLAERQLLGKTLMGSIQVMADLLALSNPLAFRHVRTVMQVTLGVARELGVKNLWKLEAAVIFSQIGFTSIPGPVLEKHFRGESLSPDENTMVSALPQISQDLIQHIPRLGGVAKIIALHSTSKNDDTILNRQSLPFKAHLLHTAIDYDRMRSRGLPHRDVVKVLEHNQRDYAPVVVEAIAKLKFESDGLERLHLYIDELKPGMILDEDITTIDHVMLIPKGLTINQVTRQRLKNYRLQGEIEDRIWVLIPPAENLPNARKFIPSPV